MSALELRILTDLVEALERPDPTDAGEYVLRQARSHVFNELQAAKDLITRGPVPMAARCESCGMRATVVLGDGSWWCASCDAVATRMEVQGAKLQRVYVFDEFRRTSRLEWHLLFMGGGLDGRTVRGIRTMREATERASDLGYAVTERLPNDDYWK